MAAASQVSGSHSAAGFENNFTVQTVESFYAKISVSNFTTVESPSFSLGKIKGTVSPDTELYFRFWKIKIVRYFLQDRLWF